MNNKIALITGASSGIGYQTALTFARNGYQLIVTGRRKERLVKLAEEIQTDYQKEVKILCFDIRDVDQTRSTLESLSKAWKKVDVLVNNAGLSLGLSNFLDADLQDWQTMLETNVIGLMQVSQIVGKWMVSNTNGHIINLSSIAGKQVYAKGNGYCASKHAVHALTQSLRIDLLAHGIRVSSVSPGNVQSEFSQVRFKNDAKKAKSVYEGYEPLEPIDIADLIYFVASRPRHVNVNDIEVTPLAQANAYYWHKP